MSAQLENIENSTKFAFRTSGVMYKVQRKNNGKKKQRKVLLKQQSTSMKEIGSGLAFGGNICQYWKYMFRKILHRFQSMFQS